MKKNLLATPLILGFLFLLVFWQPFSGKQNIDTSGWQQLIPSDKLPNEIKCMNSNNNLDAILFNDRYYVAFRTAPSHFASKKSKIYVISSLDFNNWRFEKEIHLGNDLREPRFADYKNDLFLYFFEGGNHPLKFEPKHIWMTRLVDKSNWSPLVDLSLDGFVPWRLRVKEDTLYLSAYYGKDIYSSKHKGDLRLFKSTDGFNWQPISKSPQTPKIGGEEGEFVFDTLGNLWGTVRLEGDGGMIVHAKADNIAKWTTKYTKKKYDSALLLEHNNDIFLISRRNLDGNASKGDNRLYNLIRYSFTRKKTALFKLNKENLSLDFIKDFPSTGDNSFPALANVKEQKGTYYLLNYSNDIYGKEKNWIRGQLGKTYIYFSILDIKNISSQTPSKN